MKRNVVSRFLLLWVVGMLLSVQVFAQGLTVKGVVKDNTGMGVIGANILVKGTTNGTITDFDGNFTLEAKKGDVIVISFIGYKTQELPAAATMNVTLQDDTEVLDDVVVIGYGSVKKDDATGSVTAIKPDELSKGITTNAQDMLTGKVAGVSVISNDGTPGGGAQIRIRGGSSLNASNDPLIVIDGLAIDNNGIKGMSNGLSMVNPEDIENAKLYADKVINSGYYELCDDYKLMFMADNDENQKAMKEIILPIRQDGMKTRNYGGSTYLICGTRTGGMPHMGTTNGWSCLIARNALVYKFFDEDEVPMIPENVEVPGQSDFANDEAIDSWDAQYGVRTQDMIEAAGDDRAMFYSGAGGGKRTMDPKSITGFQSGLSIVKWQNIRSDGASTSHTEYPDTDIPLFRLAEAYLTRAEANFRLNQKSLAWEDIKTLRAKRGCTKQPTLNELTEMYLLDEWSREFYLEGRRRSDLIRFDCFTTDKYLWDWKGGVKEGKSVSDIYNVYPIPATDLNNNNNMHQNEGY